MRISDWSSDVCSSDLQSTSADTERIDQLEAKVRAQDEQITQLRQMLGEQQRTLDALDDRGRQWTQAQAGELDALRARGEAADAAPQLAPAFIAAGDRKSVVEGKSVSVRVDLGGARSIKKKQQR